MKRYATIFVTHLFVIGMAINIRTDIPFWKQLVGYVIIAAIVPCAKIMEDLHEVKGKETNEKNRKLMEGYNERMEK